MNINDLVNKYDPQNQFDVLVNSYKQIEFAWNNNINISGIDKSKINNIIITGLGGSAIAGDLLKNYLQNELKFPYQVNRNYYLPSYANENTLLIVSSYSGNTEETIEVFKKGIEKGCQIICITTGGTITKIAQEFNFPIIFLKPGFQPRYALGVSFFTLLKIFQELNLIENHNETVHSIIKIWKEKGLELSRENNDAKIIADKILNKIPIIYSAEDLTSAVGNRLKCQFNENSKLHAFHNLIPELNHNEIIGWETFENKTFNCILISIHDINYHEQIKKRFSVTESLIEKSGCEVIRISGSQESFKERLMYLIYFGDWITYYTAVLRGFDPSTIKYIDFLKESLTAS